MVKSPLCGQIKFEVRGFTGGVSSSGGPALILACILSFANWPALDYAILDNIVPDFPLVNKSFNLSYAGNDL